MSGKCQLPCYGCDCTCKQTGKHPNCMNCSNCSSNDNHDRKS